MKKIKKYPHLFWLWLTRPYPFQLWVAPRKKKWCFSKPEAEPKRKSPPGFPDDYAMYLYPDSIHTYWLIYFLSSVCFHFILDIFIKGNEIHPLRYIAGILLFAISYQSIYIIFRKPVLDELWPFWPETKKQKEYFKSIPSRITSNSSFDEDKYERKQCCFCYISIIIYRNLLKIKEDLFFCRYTYLKSIHYFNRPIFFNPNGSIQEGLLRAAIADFFADKKKFIKNIFIYYVPHVWISFLYLSANLLFAFRWHPYNNQNETIPLLILIVAWAVVSVPILFKQYMSIKLFYDYDEKLFRFSPKIVSNLSKKNMRLNDNFVKSFDPKKTFGLLHAAAFGSYLVILNLVMQYEDPSKTETNKPAAEQKVENKCRHVQQVNIIESSPCQEKCCLKIISE